MTVTSNLHPPPRPKSVVTGVHCRQDTGSFPACREPPLAGELRTQNSSLKSSIIQSGHFCSCTMGEDLARLELPCVVEASDSLSLAGLFEGNHDLVEYFAMFTQPESLAHLAACSSAFFTTFTDESLWEAKLSRHFGLSRKELAGKTNHRREFSRRTVCSWLNLSTHQLGVEKPGQDHKCSQDVSHSCSCPLSTSGLENTPPRFAQGVSGVSNLASDRTVERSSSVRISPCAIARLRHGLTAIMMGGSEHISACPEQPFDWRVWSAHVACPLGIKYHLRLTFLFDDETGDVQSLPSVLIISPTCFHPNVDASGRLCEHALERRCTPVDLVGDQLRGILSVLHRPVFAVPPLNKSAARDWYAPVSKRQDLKWDAASPKTAIAPSRAARRYYEHELSETCSSIETLSLR